MKRRSAQPPRAPGPQVTRNPQQRPGLAPQAPLDPAHADPKAVHDAAGIESVAGEEDPGSALDPPAPPDALEPGGPSR